MSDLPLSELSKLAGFHKNRLSSIKHSCKDLWKYITDKEKVLSEAYLDYINESIATRDAVIMIYFKLKEKREITAFSKFAFKQEESKKDFYKSQDALKTVFQKIFNPALSQIPFSAFLKYKKIVEFYERWEKENLCQHQ